MENRETTAEARASLGACGTARTLHRMMKAKLMMPFLASLLNELPALPGGTREKKKSSLEIQSLGDDDAN